MNASGVIYLVCKGERGEGHDPVAAHTAWSNALYDAQKTRGANTAPFVEEEPGRWKSSTNGVDEVWIVRLPVDGKADIPRRDFVKPRGLCSVCELERALTTSGTIQSHELKRGKDGRYRGLCPGSRRPPKVTP